MIEHSQRLHIKQAALHAFDQSQSRRRTVRQVAGIASGCAMIAVAVAVALQAQRAGVGTGTGIGTGIGTGGGSSGGGASTGGGIAIIPAVAKLPSFVEVIHTDTELAAELEASGSCEGVGRDGDRIFIIPCAASTG